MKSRAIDTRRHRAALPVFTPSAVSPEALAMRTVGREAEIERLVRAIRTAATTENRPHQLIVGPRGSGKSHLLIVALHEALSDQQIADRVAMAMLPEDAVEIAGYADLLVSIVDRAPGGSDDRRDEARDKRVRHDTAGLERMVLEQLADRVLVLVVENLDRVFRDLGEQGQARLRNLTETSGRILLLASTPLLFDAVSDHARPWYGSFDVEHLRELDAEQGRDLLQRVAVAAGDDELAASLDTPTGLSRVKAVEHLAGGSPRMWTVLAGCITVDLLDELVPLVEALFDELAPYYQQRLWELGGVERKLVYELCRVQAATVKNLAHAVGLSQRAAATSLGRLHEANWVRREKRSGADQRATWYSLREPLLRHHVEYRETRADQLPAIVGFLRTWFETKELLARLAKVVPASVAENYVLAALSGEREPSRWAAWPVVADCDELVTVGRCWIRGEAQGGLASVVTGVIAEAVGIAVRDDVRVARDALASRLRNPEAAYAVNLTRAAERAIAAVGKASEDRNMACRRGLTIASEAESELEDRDRIALGLLAGSMVHTGAHGAWFRRYETLAERLASDHRRLQIIFRAMWSLDNPWQDVEKSLADAREMLVVCASELGASDWTTRTLVWRSVALSVIATGIDQQRALASTVVDLMTRPGSGPSLSHIVLFAYCYRGAWEAVAELNAQWCAIWAAATAKSEELAPVHRFLSLATMRDMPNLDDLSDGDRAHLLPVLDFVRSTLGSVEVEPARSDARSRQVTARSSSSGPSLGS